MSERKYNTVQEVFQRGAEAINIPFKDIDTTNRLKAGKGAIGSILEESWFGYRINNESEPDFKEARVELKATPYIRNSNGIRAKERLVCNIIDYMKEFKATFETSSFFNKCQTMLIMSYEHLYDVPKGNYKIDAVLLFRFPEKDLVIIEQDWKTIVKKIRSGHAHEISEGDTLYLAACTKGATSATSLRKQPASDIPAKQRAYSLKASYMTYVLNKYIFGDALEPNMMRSTLQDHKVAPLLEESVIKNASAVQDAGGFEAYIVDKVRPYFGKTQEELVQNFGIISRAKNTNELLLAKMLGVKGRISKTEEFQKAGIVPKTIRINHDGSVTESMSFPSFIPKKLIQEEWDTSEFKDYLEQTKFLFVIFQFESNGELIFRNLMFWNIPQPDLVEVGVVWRKTVELLKMGLVLKRHGQRTFNNFPKASENRVAHVRPHALNKQDTFQLPDGRSMPKHCFWLNNKYIANQIKINKSN